MVKSNSDLNNINPDFLKNKYTVRLAWDGFNSEFINKFINKFIDIKYLDLGTFTDEKISLDFVYKFKKLEGLVFPLWKKCDFILECDKLPKSLYSLNLNVWTKKSIINSIDALNKTNLQHLVISGFEEKDLTILSGLTNLKSLSFKTARIKSLKGIETLTNLKVLSFGGVRSLTDVSDIVTLQKLKFLEFDICWKMQDFSSIGKIKNLEVLHLMDCKNLASIKFVKNMPKLRQLYTLGTTIINDFDTTPAQNIPIFFGSQDNKYNKQYPEKEIIEGQRTESNYL
ncbi:MAG TPA: hypothetical protein EYG92_03825 [Lutibacter sp.]|nr:hypothetical protein [Lutibacter sp.]